MESLALTLEQERILESQGDILVLAGPGCGKTFTLLQKVKRLLERGVPLEKIIILSFSLKVARELKEKLAKLGLGEVKADTFHGFAFDLYRETFQKDPPLISKATQREILKKLFPREREPLKEKDHRRIYFEYLRKTGLLDFELLLYESSKFLKPSFFKDYHIIIDEFQDLSPDILEFLKSLKDATFYLFGDPNQSIYGFRGVSLKDIQVFLSTYKPGLRILTLTQSFRCPKEILFIANFFKDSPWETPPYHGIKEGGKIAGFLFSNPSEEIDFLVKLLTKLIGGTGLEKVSSGLAPSQIFILSRIKKVLDPLIKALQREGIPINLLEETAKLLQEEIILWVEKISLKKVPLEKALQESSSLTQNLLENWYYLFQKDKEKLLNLLKTLPIEELIFPGLEGINLLTIHSAKGLEAEIVLLYGVEEGLIPFTLYGEKDLAEEKRILYVALTRAKREFYFSGTYQRKLFNFTLNKGLSPWLKNLPYKEFKKKPGKPTQKALF